MGASLLPFEFAMYLMVLGLGMMRMLSRFGVADFIGAVSWSSALHSHRKAKGSGHGTGWMGVHCFHGFIRYYMSSLGLLFLCGTMLLMFKNTVRLDWRICAACLAGLGASVLLKPAGASLVVTLCLPYAVIYFAFLKLPQLQAITRYGDFSYGVYVYAFPVQQMVLHEMLTHGIELLFVVYVAICCILTLVLGMLSWFLVEKPMLKLKKEAIACNLEWTLWPDAKGLRNRVMGLRPGLWG